MTDLPTAPRVPVLFLVFNRPKVTAEVFSAIRAARPPRLYVAADGPRSERAGESERVAQARAIATAVDWPCEVKTLFRERNLGCRMAVSGAITWFFAHEESGIILEDDCLPAPSFFPFCETLLERYRDDTRIWQICGTNPLPSAEPVSSKYFFSRYDSCWGWGTWRRAWKAFDADMRDWPRLKEAAVLEDIFPLNVARHYEAAFDRVHGGSLDSWAYPWTLARARNGLTVIPGANLIQNLGFGPEATHTTDRGNPMSKIRAGQIELPLHHPEVTLPSKKIDADWVRMSFRKRHFRVLIIRAIGMVRKLLSAMNSAATK